GTGAFDGQAGGLRYTYDSSRGVTVVQGDTNGDGVADFAIDLTGNLTLTTADTLIGTMVTPALSAGAFDAEALALSFPTNLTPGTYYVGAITDYNGQVTESSESNNASNGV